MCIVCTHFADTEKRLEALEQKFEELNPIVQEMKKTGMIKPVYSVKEAAKLIGKSAYTVSEYCRQGKISATRTSTDGMYLIAADSLIKFTQKTA